MEQTSTIEHLRTEIYILWMTRPLQTMTQYTVITKDITTIDGNNKLEAILVYAYIKSRENYATHSLDNLTYEEIHYKLLSNLSN